jgi:hypothetical protein
MRILSLDYAPLFVDGTRDDEVAAFESDISVFDYDVVIWDPARTSRRYQWTGEDVTYNGLPALDEDTSARFLADLERRRNEFVEYLKTGRTLVVVCTPPQRLYVRNGDYTVSGTGRNQQRTHSVVERDVLSALPIEIPDLSVARGGRVSVAGDGRSHACSALTVERLSTRRCSTFPTLRR